MVWCSNCARYISRPDNVDGKICCSLCGRVLDEDNFSQEAQFMKNAAGQAQLAGNLVRTVANEHSASRERTLNEAHGEMIRMLNAMQIDGGDYIARPALAFYTIAVEKDFTRGRKKDLVRAACVYIVCRENKKPFLLIDFSDFLRINVYELGAVFLRLCQLLSLQEHPIIQKPVDPSLFIHRFADRLFGGKKPVISRTALRILTSMKRDWLQTGRKPSGLCGAALYISALSHGHKISKSEIRKVVHVCDATLTKRLIEFENTESGGLTIDEFNKKAEELEKDETMIKSLNTGAEASGTSELLCEHKGTGKPPFAHGLCKSCYDEFIELSGGLNGGSEPPAFQRAEMERKMADEADAESFENLDSSTLPGLAGNKSKLNKSDERKSINNVSEAAVLQEAESDSPDNLQSQGDHDSSNDRDDPTFEESETLSDIDDTEVDFYLHTEKETEFKTIIWEEMNKEYLAEQAAKEAAAAVAKANEVDLSKCSEEEKAAYKLAAAAAASVAKSKKEKQRKRAAEMKNSGPAQTAAEATRQMLDRKRLSSKVRYDVLEKLFDESESTEITKKTKIEVERDPDDNYLDNKDEDPEFEGNGDDGYVENVEEFDYDNNDYNDFDEGY